MADSECTKKDVEVVVIEEDIKVVVIEEEPPNLIFGPDGAINDPALLKLIQQKKPLAPVDLFKLAAFFDKFLPNVFLAERLLVSALATIIADPRLQEQIQAFFAVGNDESQDIAGDVFEISPPDEDDPRAHTHEDPKDDNDTSFIFAPLFHGKSNSGVLVESSTAENGKISFFAVGVCPDPADLPAVRPERLKLRKSRATQK